MGGGDIFYWLLEISVANKIFTIYRALGESVKTEYVLKVTLNSVKYSGLKKTNNNKVSGYFSLQEFLSMCRSLITYVTI